MAIAYDFPYDLLESEIGASTNAEDIQAAHEMALLRHHLTVINVNLNAIYSKEMCVWLNVAQMKVEEM